MATIILRRLKSNIYVAAVIVLMAALLLPAINSQRASAVTVTDRSLSLSSNVNSGTATYTLQFDVNSGGIGAFEVAFCTTPLLGTVCNSPAGLSVTGVGFAGTGGLKTGGSGGTNRTGFSLGTSGNAPACGVATTSGTVLSTNTIAATGNNACGIRIAHSTSSQTFATGPGEVWMQFTAITNPTAAGTFFARVYTFNNIGYSSPQDGGTMANSVQALQNVSFKVQETLAFCVGAMPNATVAYYAGDGTTPAVGTTFAGTASLTNNCAQSAGTSINMGVAPDSTTTCLTPVSVRSAGCVNGSDGDNRYAYIMLATNAAGGATVGHRVNSAGTYTQGTLQVPSASCTFPSQTDECIDPVNGNTPGNPIGMPTITTTEAVGMVVSARNTQGRATTALTRTTGATGYSGTGLVSGGTACSSGTSANNTNCWNWNRTGTGTLASSTGPIDNEALQVLFATKSAITTPPGQYSVDIDYYSVPTY